MNAEWLNYNGYFVRTAVKVGRRAKGGWSGELDVVAFHPGRPHFLHVECSIDAYTWQERETRFGRKFMMGRDYGRDLFSGMELPTALDQVIVHGYAAGADRHRSIGGGRLITSQELASEIIAGIPASLWTNAVPENYPLLRTLQLAKMAGAKVGIPLALLIPRRITRDRERLLRCVLSNAAHPGLPRPPARLRSAAGARPDCALLLGVLAAFYGYAGASRSGRATKAR